MAEKTLSNYCQMNILFYLYCVFVRLSTQGSGESRPLVE